MGGKLSCPSEVLDPVWVPDDSVTHCCNCGGVGKEGAGSGGFNSAPGSARASGANTGRGAAAAAAAAAERAGAGGDGSLTARGSNFAAGIARGPGAGEQGKFSFSNRRHHCRACGGCFCNSPSCWGAVVQLEAIYGFPGPVPVCSVCADVLVPGGSMYALRKGITVAFTHEPRSNVTAESQIPPLATTNVKARRFTTNHIRLHKWRPFTRRTMLLLSKTKSSRDILRSRSGLGGATPRARSSSTRRSLDGDAGVRDSTTSTTSNTGGAGDWTIDLDAVESIQLMNVAEKDGGDFVLISTDFEEHRLQAVKMRFEEMATLNNQAALDAVETASRAVSEGTSLSPDGGDRDNASDRRSAVSAGTRLRTVMLDREGTIELFNSLRRAHAVCRRRATSYPAEIRSFIDIDPPVDETAIGAMPDGLMSGGMGGPSAVTGMTPRSVPVAIPGSAAASQERIFSGSMGASPSMLGGASLGGPAAVGASSPNPAKRAGLPPIAPVGTRGSLAAADNNAF